PSHRRTPRPSTESMANSPRQRSSLGSNILRRVRRCETIDFDERSTVPDDSNTSITAIHQLAQSRYERKAWFVQAPIEQPEGFLKSAELAGRLGLQDPVGRFGLAEQVVHAFQVTTVG